MKMQQFHGRDMRQALARVRAALGPDAVILSTQRSGNEVVVSAAVDYELDARPPPAAAAPAAVARAVDPPMPPLPRLTEIVADLQESWAPEAAAAADGLDDFALGDAVSTAGSGPPDAAAAQQELRDLRRLLESQAAALAWNDYTRRRPLEARVLAELAHVGIARDLALAIVEELPEQTDAEAASRLPLALLARRIQTTTPLALQHGGVMALIGPNGAGKTTTLAKFATRWVLERGPRELALVSTDRERFGSQEQFEAFGRELGVPALMIEGPEALAKTLERLRDRRLVLVDTPGLNPRSERLEGELQGLGDLGIELALVLSASAQAGALEEAALRFGALGSMHCVLTRLDEATSLGGAVSMFARSGLPVSWLCDGPRVPEDLEQARGPHLVARAVRLARAAGACADEDLLARRFGGLLDAAA